MAQNRPKDETLDLQVPTESSLSLPTPTISGCGSIGPDPARLREPIRSRSSPLNQNKKRTADDNVSCWGLRDESAKRPVNRCSGCRKRVGLTGFRCRCGDLFCSDHRYSDRHECSYDYKTAGRAVIARENPVVRAAKVVKV